jgi:phosphatidate cytidylyltransferase
MGFKVRDIGLRAASALVLAPLAMLAVWLGGVWILGVLLIASVVLSTEWAKMSAPSDWKAIAAAVSLALLATLLSNPNEALSFSLVLLVFGGAAAGLFAKVRRLSAVDAAYGVLYLGWPMLLLIWLRDGNSAIGFYWVTLAFVVAWASDIVAFLVGSAIGGPKLWPRFSPNKTWSGFIGGLVAGTLAGAAMAALPEAGVRSVEWSALLGFAAALATMAGDLWESALKRRFGVKDAGTLIPGHGGLMDRVDGLMFAVVVVAIGRSLSLYFDGGT